MTANTFDESKIRRGQPDNRGKFASKMTSDPTGELALIEPAFADDVDEDLACRDCGEPNDNGEGSDGYCGSCADERTCRHCADEKEPGALTCGDDECTTEAKREHAEEVQRYARVTNVSEGMRTPWGKADYVTHYAWGVSRVGTPGHGGVKLAPERNRSVPASLRNSDGWYEEDVEAAVPIAIFPDAFEPFDSEEAERRRTEASDSIRSWMPGEWEAWTGREVQPGESLIRDEEVWRAAHRGDFVVTSAITAESDPDLVVVTAARADDDARGEYLVPKDEYRSADTGRFVVDPARHARLPAEDKDRGQAPREERIRDLPDLRFEKLTASQQSSITRDLEQQYRFADGVRSLNDHIESHGVSARRADVDNGRRSYRLSWTNDDEHGSSSSVPISKATFDYLEHVPDGRSKATVAYQDASVYEHRIQQISARGEVPTSAQRRKLEEMRARAAEVAQQERDDERPGMVRAAEERKRAKADRERAAMTEAPYA